MVKLRLTQLVEENLDKLMLLVNLEGLEVLDLVTSTLYVYILKSLMIEKGTVCVRACVCKIVSIHS